MEHGTAPGDTTGPGHGNPRCLFSSLLVLPVACRGLGARRQSLLSGLEPLRSLVVCFISSFTVLATTWNHHWRFSWTCRPAHSQGGRRVHAVRSLLRPVTLPGPLALCPSPSSSHHHSRIPSLTPSIAVCALPRLLPSTCRCRPSISAAVSFPSALSFLSAVSASAVSPRPFPLTYHICCRARTRLAHVASALIFCLNLAHHVSVLIRRSRRVAPRPSATVIIALRLVLALSALACASPSASLSSRIL